MTDERFLTRDERLRRRLEMVEKMDRLAKGLRAKNAVRKIEFSDDDKARLARVDAKHGRDYAIKGGF